MSWLRRVRLHDSVALLFSLRPGSTSCLLLLKRSCVQARNHLKFFLSYYVPLEAFDATAVQYDFSENVGVASVMVIVSVAVAVSVVMWSDAALK